MSTEIVVRRDPERLNALREPFWRKLRTSTERRLDELAPLVDEYHRLKDLRAYLDRVPYGRE